ncbi:MAG: exo-alpha-sialidase [Gammaproteobacteria bacterium]|nr:MAG: exo-alpha-sialidase [Gammaproteobacteria bacterium]
MTPKTDHIQLSFLLGLISILFLSVPATALSGKPDEASNGSFADMATAQSREGLYISATFDSNGRLWRLIPTRNHMYVDYSDDFGQNYSKAVQINASSVKIKALAEDRPSIVVDKNGRIMIVYFTNDKQPWTSWFTFSDDHGQTFSTPTLISDHAATARHYQDQLFISPSDRLYHFWYDERNKHNAGKSGATLYFTTTTKPETLKFPNQPLKDSNCECCRMAIDSDIDGYPTIFSRFLLPGSIRDHGIMKVSPAGIISGPTRVTEDLWEIHACPEHGPSLSISENGRYHMTWFTQGSVRQGLFYAWSDQQGAKHSEPMQLGNPTALPSHAYVKALENRVAIIWKEFNGQKTEIKLIQSTDYGENWSSPSTIAESSSASDHPFLITTGKTIFLSWNSLDNGYQLITINPK